MSFCATLADEWARAGIRDAVISPGSRSTPLAIALSAEPRIRLHVVLDERSASFLALGIALATGRAVVVACTSGTAPTHFHPAVVEASQAGIPLIVCTADRPPELHDVGAPQTIDQVGLYGSAVRWAANPGVADATSRGSWRSLAARAVAEATGSRPGPVHLNLMFREPLIGPDEPLPPGRPDGRPWHRATVAHRPPTDPWLQSQLDASTRTLVIAGAGAPTGLITGGVPVLSDHRAPYSDALAHWDALLRAPGFVASHYPDLVICAGVPPASKVLAQWLASLDVPQIVLAPPAGWVDPAHTATAVVTGNISATATSDAAWTRSWSASSGVAAAAIDRVIAGHRDITEPAVARTLLSRMPSASNLFAASSMPIRDLEWFGAPRNDVTVLANRGANGIDGVLSSATGVALAANGPTALLSGDLAFLHDTNGLLGLARRGVDLVIVVVDNDGGGIFSFLPQHDALDAATFEVLFGTPQHVDLVSLATVHDISGCTVDLAANLGPAIDHAFAAGGVQLIVAQTNRESNVSVHAELNQAVADALADTAS